jgi:hypothetical protein
MRPSDHCPYARPFPAGFADCPAFQQVRFIPLSSNYQPLEPVMTCRHLVSRQLPGDGGRWYPACRLGNAQARLAWVEAVEPSRLAAISRLRAEMAGLNAPFIDELWRLKGRQLAAGGNLRDDELRRQMLEVGERFLLQTRTFLESHSPELLEIEVTAEPLVELLRLSIENLIARSSGEMRWEVPEQVLLQFPRPVQLFFRPPVRIPSTAPVE